jgi:hypothetical protein
MKGCPICGGEPYDMTTTDPRGLRCCSNVECALYGSSLTMDAWDALPRVRADAAKLVDAFWAVRFSEFHAARDALLRACVVPSVSGDGP